MTIQEVRKYRKKNHNRISRRVTEKQRVKRKWWPPTRGKKGKRKKKNREIMREREREGPVGNNLSPRTNNDHD